MPENPITINSRKFDGTIHKSWKAELLSETEELLTFVGIFENEVIHPKLGIIRRGTVSYEFYWKNRWFNIFRFHEPDGKLRNFYCNLNMPPVLSENALDYVDLDIDVLVWQDFSFQILDLDEFEQHALKYNYSNDLRETINLTLKELLSMIEKKSFPFDYKI
jgi:protein associated with RNAse G/E